LCGFDKYSIPQRGKKCAFENSMMYSLRQHENEYHQSLADRAKKSSTALSTPAMPSQRKGSRKRENNLKVIDYSDKYARTRGVCSTISLDSDFRRPGRQKFAGKYSSSRREKTAVGMKTGRFKAKCTASC
jgi:hypothetical protein